MIKCLRQRRNLGTREPEGAVVEEIDHIHSLLGEHSVYLAHHLTGGQVPRHADATKGVAQHQVATEPADAEPSVFDNDLDALAGLQLELLGVDLDDTGSISDTKLEVPGRTCSR
jgi:hypothetical protein